MTKKIKKMLLLELGILLLALMIFIIAKDKIFTIIPQCIVNRIFGLQCPSCGGTRCVINFILGNFKESFCYHPIFFFTIIYFSIINFIYIINAFRENEIATYLYPKLKFWIIWIIILIIFTILRNIIL